MLPPQVRTEHNEWVLFFAREDREQSWNDDWGASFERDRERVNELLEQCLERRNPALSLVLCLEANVPEAVSRLTWLRALRLSPIDVPDCDPALDLGALRGLTALEYLRCSGQPVASLEPLERLRSLSWLDCGHTWIESLRPLRALTSLSHLDCSTTRVNDIAPLVGLKGLQYLNCSNTRVNDLKPLQHLGALECLKCSRTDINSLDPLKELERLSELDCSKTKIASLRGLCDRTPLVSLNLAGTLVRDLEPVRRLSRLEELVCAKANVTSLEPLRGRESLSRLDCSGTGVSSLQPLEGLESLSELDCSNTLVEDLEPLRGLRALKWLKCRATGVESLRPLAKLASLEHLDAAGAPVHDVPQELLRDAYGAPRRVRAFFRELAHDEEANREHGRLDEVNALLVGNFFVGKTHLAEALVRGEPVPPDLREGPDGTHGIVRTTVSLEDENETSLSVHLWDFAGQEIYHATHRLFLRNRALYLVLWTDYHDPATPDDSPLHPVRYWLDLVARRAPDSPVMLVQTKVDAADEKSRPPNLGLHSDRIKSESGVSATGLQRHHKAALEGLLAHLRAQAQDMLSERCRVLPSSWVAVRDRLAAYQGSPFISLDEYYAIARYHEVGEPDVLLGYLHDSGNIFFQEGAFGGAVILDQSWAISLIYALFDPRPDSEGQGRSVRARLQNLLLSPGYLLYSDIEHALQRAQDRLAEDECSNPNLPPLDDVARHVLMQYLLATDIAFEHIPPDGPPRFTVPALLPSLQELQQRVARGENSPTLGALALWRSVGEHEWSIEVQSGGIHRAWMQALIAHVGRGATLFYAWRDGILTQTLADGGACLWAYLEADGNGSTEALSVRIRGSLAERARVLGEVYGRLRDPALSLDAASTTIHLQPGTQPAVNLDTLRTASECSAPKVRSADDPGVRLNIEPYLPMLRAWDRTESPDSPSRSAVWQNAALACTESLLDGHPLVQVLEEYLPTYQWDRASQLVRVDGPAPRLVTRVPDKTGHSHIFKFWHVPTPEHEEHVRAEIQAASDCAGIIGVPRLSATQQQPVQRVLWVRWPDLGVASLTEVLRWTVTDEAYVDRVIRIACGLARTLHGLHGRDLVYGDLKPANVVLSPLPDETGEQQPYLVDFGCTQRAGPIQREAGTPGFYAPEQARELLRVRTGKVSFGEVPESMTAQTDVYGLGATLHWLLTRGDFPYREAAAKWNEQADALARFALEDHQVRDRYQPPETAKGAELPRLIRRMLALRPTQRATLDEVLQTLDFLRERRRTG